jgi:hypothetical protein
LLAEQRIRKSAVKSERSGHEVGARQGLFSGYGAALF